MTGDYPIEAPGWAAIDRASLAIHPGQVPHQFTSNTAYDLEGTAPLPAISVWEGAAPAHWHYVGYGLSELFEKTSPTRDISGLGYELCMRIPRGDEEEPPAWPLRLIQGVAHYAMSGHREIETGDVMDLGSSIVGDQASHLRGIVCVPDPQLGKIATPHGSLLFLLLLGLTAAELDVVQQLDPQRRVGLVNEAAPGGITEPTRESWTKDPNKAPILRRYQLGVLI